MQRGARLREDRLPEKACTKNQECIDANGGAPYACRRTDGKCVSLLSANCQTLFGTKKELLDDNLVVIGGTLPFDENGRQANFAVSLARTCVPLRGGKVAGPISSGFTYDPVTGAKGTPAACVYM